MSDITEDLWQLEGELQTLNKADVFSVLCGLVWHLPTTFHRINHNFSFIWSQFTGKRLATYVCSFYLRCQIAWSFFVCFGCFFIHLRHWKGYRKFFDLFLYYFVGTLELSLFNGKVQSIRKNFHLQTIKVHRKDWTVNKEQIEYLRVICGWVSVENFISFSSFFFGRARKKRLGICSTRTIFSFGLSLVAIKLTQEYR